MLLPVPRLTIDVLDDFPDDGTRYEHSNMDRHWLLTQPLTLIALIVVLGCDSTGPADNARPVITAISPATVPAGSAGMAVTVTGSGFVPSTRVRIDGGDRTTTWQSDTRLTVALPASDFLAPGTRMVTAHSPPPGGGSSAASPLVIIVAPLLVDSLSPATLTVGSGSTTVAVFGMGFRPGAIVRWDGADRPTVRVSPTQLRVSLSWMDLAAASTHAIAVHHTGAQPDSSAARQFIVANRTPVVLTTNPSSTTAGRTAFTLTVNGSEFAPGAVVRWNGALRPTTFVSSSELRADIAAADVAALGTATIRVENPTPAIAPSNDVAFAIRQPGHHLLPIVTGDVAWDPLRSVLYASVRSTDARFPNRVIALDPMTGEVIRSVLVGSDPRRLALSDDLSVLYVALDGAAAIRRVDLSTFTAGLQFPLLTYLDRILYADDIAVRPGHPETVAVTHQVHGFSEGKGAGLAIYDNGVPRGTLIPGGTVVAFAGPDTLFGYDGQTTSHSLTRMLLSDTGLVEDTSASGLIQSFFADIVYLNGLLFSSQGPIVDAVRMLRVASVSVGGTVATDASGRRVFYFWRTELSAIDATTFQSLGTQSIAGVPALELPGYESPTLVRWGADGFSYFTTSSLVLFRSSLAIP